MQREPPRQLRKVVSSIRIEGLGLGVVFSQLWVIHTKLIDPINLDRPKVRFETMFSFILIHIAFDLDQGSL